MSTYTCIETYVAAPGVGAIKLNRPQVLNALSLQTMIELVSAFETYDADPEIGKLIRNKDFRHALSLGIDRDHNRKNRQRRSSHEQWHDITSRNDRLRYRLAPGLLIFTIT